MLTILLQVSTVMTYAAAGHAVYGGFKTADVSVRDPLAYSAALDAVVRALADTADG